MVRQTGGLTKSRGPGGTARAPQLQEQSERSDSAPSPRLGFELSGVTVMPPALPHRAAIQRSFGAENDLSSVRATIGGPAAAATQARGAEAMARGEELSFAASPSLQLAAHEAAHVIQQRRGGAPAGKEAAWERHADAVAAQVLAGRSAASLFAQLPTSQPTVQTQLSGRDSAGRAAVTPAAAGSTAAIPGATEVSIAPEDALAKAQDIVYGWFVDILGSERPRNLGPGQAARVDFQDDATFDRGYPGFTPEELLTGDTSRLQRIDAYTVKATSQIRVREVHLLNPLLTRLLVHELLHTLASSNWQPPKKLDEAATQYLTLCAYYETTSPTPELVDLGGAYQEETKLLIAAMQEIAGEQAQDMLARVYFTGNNTQLVQRINQRLSPGSSAGFRIFLAGFLPRWPLLIDGYSVPPRESRLSTESPAATLMGLLTGERRLTQTPGSGPLITVGTPAAATAVPRYPPPTPRRGPRAARSS